IDRPVVYVLGLEPHPSHFRQLDFEREAEARCLVVVPLNQAAAAAQVVDTDRRAQQIDTPPVERPTDSWVESILDPSRPCLVLRSAHTFGTHLRHRQSSASATVRTPTSSHSPIVVSD